MAWAYVGGGSGSNNTGSALTVNVQNVGDCLIAIGLASNQNGSISFSDGTTTFTADHTTADTTNGVKMSIASLPNLGSTGNRTITPTPSVGTMLALAVLEYSSLPTSSAADGAKAGASNFGNTGGLPSSGNVSPATGAANELVLGVLYDSGGSPTGAFQTFVEGGGFTKRQNPSIGFLVEDQDSGASGSTPAATFTSDKAFTYWLAAAVVYKIAAAGGVLFRRGLTGRAGSRPVT